MARVPSVGSRRRSRWGIAAVLTVVAVAAAIVVGAKIVLPERTRALCAEFTDAVGLYPGNKVALLGIEDPHRAPVLLDQPRVVGGHGERRLIPGQGALQRGAPEDLGRLDRPQAAAIQRSRHRVSVVSGLLDGVRDALGSDDRVGLALLELL